MSMLSAANLSTLAVRKDEILRNFLDQSSSCLHHVLPEPRQDSVTVQVKAYKIMTDTTNIYDLKTIIQEAQLLL